MGTKRRKHDRPRPPERESKRSRRTPERDEMTALSATSTPQEVRRLDRATILQMQQQVGNSRVHRLLDSLVFPSAVPIQRQDSAAAIATEAGVQRGSRGEAVRQIQRALLRAGYSLGRFGADGIFGRVTERALRRFQRDHDLPATGMVDSQTEAALTQTAPSSTPEQTGSGAGNLPRADLGPRSRGRAYMLDWEARHRNIAQDTTLREAFLENLELQIATIFGEALTQTEVLQQIEQAEGSGDVATAEQLLTKLRIANQYAVVDTLRVEQSERYRKRTREVDGKKRTSTYCNIYAYDVVTAMGGYLPRVWWRRQALARLRQGEEVQPVYGRTVHELNANALTDWMENHGSDFGWRQEEDITAAQDEANRGNLVIILAANVNPRRSGHVTVLMPETEQYEAERDETGQVLAPLQSQAGSRNFRYETNFRRGRAQWWEDRSHERGSAWVFEGQPSSPLLSPEQLGYRAD